jgi:Family of unknown function (DUF6214)
MLVADTVRPVDAWHDEVEIVPGVMGPETVDLGETSRHWMPLEGLELEYVFRFDRESGRYGCYQLTVHANHGVPITAASLRDVKIAEIMFLTLRASGPLTADGQALGLIRELPNPDGREPWGLQVPAEVADGGPTDRALRWVAHIYRYGLAIGYKPTKAVEEAVGLSRPRAGRWIAAAREKGFLGPAEVGKAGG